MSIIRLAIGIPAYQGRVSAEHVRMFIEIGHTLASSEERFQLVNSGYVDTCGVDRARNDLIKAALVGGATWLLMIDADTWVVGTEEDSAGYQLLRMISEADRADAAIVGAPVVRRALSRDRRELNVYRYVGISDETLTMNGVPVPPEMTASRKLVPLPEGMLPPKLVEIDAIGTAMFAINLTKVSHLMFRFNDLSEDLDFCRQAKADGHKVFVDPRVTTAHLSRSFPLIFTGREDLEEVVEKTVPELPEPSRIILP